MSHASFYKYRAELLLDGVKHHIIESKYIKVVWHCMNKWKKNIDIPGQKKS